MFEINGKLCPLRGIASESGNRFCQREACAWWRTYPDQPDSESGCAIRTIADSLLSAQGRISTDGS